MRFINWENPVVPEGELTRYHWLAQHTENLKLGKYTDIGAFSYINAQEGVIIEDFVQIGSHCSIYSISTIDNRSGRVLLRQNCRIGTHSTIMPGVTVGENAIIGAHSLVQDDIPENSVAFGIQARVIRTLTPVEIRDRKNETL